MTRANCVATVERSLPKRKAEEANVVSSERAACATTRARPASRTWLIVRKVAMTLPLAKPRCTFKTSDQGCPALRKGTNSLDGVLYSELLVRNALWRYVPTIISQSEIRQAIAEAGFKSLKNLPSEDAEAVARKEIEHQRRCSSLR